MKNALLVVDEFLPPHRILMLRRQALAVDYSPKEHQGVTYPGVGIMPMDFSREISAAVGFKAVCRPSFFRMHTKEDNDAQVGWIHADTSEAEFAGVLYLTLDEHCQGGTAFWKHNVFKQEQVERSQLFDPQYCARMNRDGLDESLWEMAGFVGMKFNRFITYPTSHFHSRYPKQTWGETKDNSRLICAIFYDRA